MRDIKRWPHHHQNPLRNRCAVKRATALHAEHIAQLVAASNRAHGQIEDLQTNREG